MWHGNPTKTFGCTLIEGSQAHPIITLSRTNPIIGTFAILGSQSFGKLGTAQMDIPKLGLIFTFPHKDDITVNDVHGYGVSTGFPQVFLWVWVQVTRSGPVEKPRDSGYGYGSHYCCLAMAL
jgi:hypothetical protein